MNGNDLKRRPQLLLFISQLSSDMSIEDNFNQSFGEDYQHMEQELRNYVSKYLFTSVVTTFRDGFEFDKETVVTPLPEAEKLGYLGDLLVGVKRFNDAESTFRKALQIDPKYGPAKITLSWVLGFQSREPESDEILASALNDDPKDYRTCYHLGVFQYGRGKYDEALKLFMRSLEDR